MPTFTYPKPAGGHRRVLLPLLGLLLGLLAGCQSSPTQTGERAAAQPPAGGYVRHNAADTAAAADLKALRVAMEKMRRLPCTDPRSWYYQAAIHGLPQPFGQKQNPYCPSYVNKDSILFGWNGCTHDHDGHGGFNAATQYHFLIWHRLYVWHFEQIVRELSGRPNFALPYWNYTSPDNYVMPAVFRLPADTATNSLFVRSPYRYPRLNNGLAIDTLPGKGIRPEGLDTAFIFRPVSYRVFNSTINGAPHNMMHTYIGCGDSTVKGKGKHVVYWNPIMQSCQPCGLMNTVESAAFDPIFWLHHANIDYLWASWSATKNGYKHLPSEPYMETHPWPHYNFITATGIKVTYTMAQAYYLATHPDYHYDVLPAHQPQPAPGGRADQNRRLVERGLAIQDRQLKSLPNPPREAAPVAVASAIPTRKPASPRRLTAILRPTGARTPALAPAGQHLLLQLDVSVPSDPLTTYAVYVRSQSPATSRTPLATRRQLAGVLTFFGIAHEHGGAAAPAMKGMKMPAALTRSFLFDVTGVLPPTTRQGPLDVELVPAVKGAPPVTIDKLTLLTQDVR